MNPISGEPVPPPWLHQCARVRYCNQGVCLSVCLSVSTRESDSNGSPPDKLKRPPGRPRITWLNTVQRDLRIYNLTLNEAVDLAQNLPLWTLMSLYGATHS